MIPSVFEPTVVVLFHDNAPYIYKHSRATDHVFCNLRDKIATNQLLLKLVFAVYLKFHVVAMIIYYNTFRYKNVHMR